MKDQLLVYHLQNLVIYYIKKNQKELSLGNVKCQKKVLQFHLEIKWLNLNKLKK
jgi:hypothetical protein